MAWSTNTDIWIVSVNGNEPINLTEDSPGADAQPSYSPDGDYLAFVSQARAGFEADQVVLEGPRPEDRRGRRLTEKLDRSVQSFTWGATRRHEAVREQGPRHCRGLRRRRLLDDPQA